MLLPHATFETLHSIHGHDAFLIEMKDLNEVVRDFRARQHRDGARGTRRSVIPREQRASANLNVK
jgi:hypothetical protein